MIIKLGKAELHNADCMELMVKYPDGYFELAIVDPPYGIGAGGKSFMNGASKTAHQYTRDLSWDSEPPAENYFLELRRVSKNQIIFGGNYFVLPPSRCFLIWDKTIHGNSYADCEMMWTSFDSVARIYRKNMVEITLDGRIHPTQKPIALYEWLLTNYAKKGDKILDTHLGSMSSVIACHNLNFQIVGSELDKDYFDAGIARVKQAMAQERLFE
jgi:site-specific DNA-methyltransferase (adenine-specific)